MNFIRWALIREQFVDIAFGNNTDSHNVSNQMDDNVCMVCLVKINYKLAESWKTNL